MLFRSARYNHYIKKIRPDCLLLECENFKKAADLEFVHWNITPESVREIKEIRKCHFSDENNVVVYEMFKEWIEKGTFNFDLNKFVAPKHSFERYFQSDIIKHRLTGQ